MTTATAPLPELVAAPATHDWMPSSPCDSGCIGTDAETVGNTEFALRLGLLDAQVRVALQQQAPAEQDAGALPVPPPTSAPRGARSPTCSPRTTGPTRAYSWAPCSGAPLPCATR